MTQAPRQTRTHIRELLARRGLNPRHDLGQNFLIDLNLLEFLVEQAQITADDVVLEVGSGTGALTAHLAERAAAVVAVEVDPRMRQLTSEAVAEFPNVTLVGCDVLRNKNRFAAPVLEALDAALLTPARRLKLVANLPYGVATPVISNLVASSYAWDWMVVTIQLELAQRMAAKEGTANYSALSAWMQAQCRVTVLKRLPPDVFWPRPKVDSAMIRIDPDARLREAIRDREILHQFLPAVFQQRRKLLRNALEKTLGAVFQSELTRTQIEEVLRSRGIGDLARAEELSPATLVDLCNAFLETVQRSRGEEYRSSVTA